MSLEAALITLGTVAVRTATKLWLGDQKIAAEVSASAVDLLSGRLAKQVDKRKFNRMLEGFAEAVVERIEPIIESEFKTLLPNDRLAAVDAVCETIEDAPLAEADLFAADLDARHLDRSIRRQTANNTRLLGADATALYDLLLLECCGYIIEISRGLPQFSANALTEILRRDREVLDGIKQVLARLPQRDRSADFEYDYRQLVARKLDHMEMFGVTLADSSRRYPLSVAYISLSAVTEDGDESESNIRVENLIAYKKRIFIRGEAGLGKTTLLHWMAVRSALRDFPKGLDHWNETIPFLIPLRRYSNRPLPSPESFLDEVGRHISDEMPKGWVQERLRTGRAVVLVDGVDELTSDRRDEAKNWLRDLIITFPDARFLITSRPGATQASWLHGEEFFVLDLMPMQTQDVRTFIERWHDAMRSMSIDDEARHEVDLYQAGLIAQLDNRAHLRKLAGYPLLCALLCALHKDRRAVLPSSRMELYEVALQMLLERRDTERKIESLSGLDRTEKVLLLGSFAYWLIRNGYSDVEVPKAIDQFSRRLIGMPQIRASRETVYRNLLERSGLLREPVDGRVDFVHRTFQEYLAAYAAVRDSDDIGVLIQNAHLDQWHEVIVMAVGHASRSQREKLLHALLERADTEDHGDNLNLLALASLETVPELEGILRTEIHRRAATLLPPKSLTAAKSFSSAGDFVIDLLAKANPQTVKEVVATIRAIADTASPEAMQLIARFASDSRIGVQRELLYNWPKFDRESYARSILANVNVDYMDVSSFDDFQVVKHLRKLRSVTLELDGNWMPDLKKISRHIESLSIRTPGVVNCADLTHFSELYDLEIDSPSIENLSALKLIRGLSDLTLGANLALEEIVEATTGLDLHGLSLYHVNDLVDLTPLHHVSSLSYLFIANSPGFVSLAGLGRWSGTLRELQVFECPLTDIDDVGHMKKLSQLSLQGTEVSDLSVLERVDSLKWLDVDERTMFAVPGKDERGYRIRLYRSHGEYRTTGRIEPRVQ